MDQRVSQSLPEVHSEERQVEPQLARGMLRRIETLRRVVAEVSMAMQSSAVLRGMRILLVLEAGPLRRVQQEGETQTVQVRWQAEGRQKLMWGMKLRQAGFG